jgi:hypothetical protein
VEIVCSIVKSIFCLASDSYQTSVYALGVIYLEKLNLFEIKGRARRCNIATSGSTIWAKRLIDKRATIVTITD